jgi:hypothetical protein
MANTVSYVLTLCVLFIVGCTGLQERVRLAQFEEVSSSYEHAIRWGHYDVAKGFEKKRERDHEARDVEKLDKVRVTSYELLDSHPSENWLTVHQGVKIRYYHADEMVERTLIDKQEWEYDETQKAWYLQTGLPDFR